MSNPIFARAPMTQASRSVFRRDHKIKTALGVNYLYPIYVDEALPSDTFEFKQSLFGRLSTPLTPYMDYLFIDTFYFAIPVRLVDKDFKKFMGERPFGDIRNDYTVPQLHAPDGIDFESLYDYMGIPPKVSNIDFCAWFPRAYNLVYNEWFRDENLCPAAPIAGVNEDGTTHDESIDDYVLRKRTKRLNYFTGCLPWPQKGEPASIGLAGTAPVLGNGFALGLQNANGTFGLINQEADGYKNFVSSAFGQPVGTINSTIAQRSQGAIGVTTDASKSGLIADLSNATAVTINQLREAVGIQHLLEAWARGGTRYIEILRSTFDVISPDARLQRPEYLGGSSQILDVTTIAQTSASEANNPLGKLASFVTMNNSASWKKSFTEHTIILGLVNIRASLSYQQGLNRMWSRKTKFDFYWPQLAHLGEQAVLNKEIYLQGNSVTVEGSNLIEDDEVFGYQERWAEYRYHPNTITGKMRSSHPQSLDVWHLSQDFDSLPKLNQAFIEEDVPIDRILAVSSSEEPPVILAGDFQIKCARPMPLYSIPGLNRL